MTNRLTVPDLSRLQPLTGSNYRRWSEELLFFFQETGLDRVLTEDQPSSSNISASPSATTSAESKKEATSTVKEGVLEDANRTCRGHIIRNLSEKLFDIYVNYDSARDIWFNLKKKYGSEDQGKVQFVTSRWTSFVMRNDLPIQEQLHEYEAIVSRIQSQGIPVDDQLAALVLIDRLPSSWNAYRCKLKHDKKKMSLDELIADIMIEDANRSFIGNVTNHSSHRTDANLVENQGRASKERKKDDKKEKTSAKQDVEFKKKYRC